MKAFHYKGKYDGNESSLPQREHPEGYVPFKEVEDLKKLSLVLNLAAVGIGFALFALVGFWSKERPFNTWGIIAFFATMIPHEFLHGICFSGDVYMYQNLSQGMLFVVSTEDISKGRFIWMSMLPNIVFGFLPFIIFLIHPSWVFLGNLGALAISAGIGDYYNVFNAITQVPNGAMTYLSGIHSYWYVKDKQ